MNLDAGFMERGKNVTAFPSFFTDCVEPRGKNFPLGSIPVRRRDGTGYTFRPALQPVIERAIHRFMERYRLSYDEAHHFHDQLWMHAHGIASMAATEFCQWNLEKVKRMLEECEYYLSRKYGV